MRKLRIWLVLLTLLCVILVCANAESEYGLIENHYKVELYSDGVWTELEKMLYFSQENEVFADGILMFSSIIECVEEGNTPIILWSPEFDFKVTIDSYIESFSTKRKIFQMIDGNLVQIENNELTFSDLEQGNYLICISCSGSHRGEAYAGACFFWLLIDN